MALLSVSNLTFAYEGSLENVFTNTSFQLDTDWKLGFVGRNGRGKTTFLKLLLGKYPYQGTIATVGVSFSYFPYDVPDPSCDTLSVLQAAAGGVPLWRLEKELSLLSVSEDVLTRPFSTLSSGEQTKALLAALFLREDPFLLIDEPTNHLDALGRALVASYLAKKRGFILVSHDRAFLDACVDHILSINKAGIEIQQGNFSSWYENRRRQDQFELEQNEKLKKEVRRLSETARQKAAWADKAEGKKIGFNPAKTEKSIGHRTEQSRKSKKMMSRAKAIESRGNAALEEKAGLLKNLGENESLKLHHAPFHARRLAEFSSVSVFYGEKAVCRDVSFTVEQGDRIALLGQNGSGKSSLLKLLCGDLSPEGVFSHTGRFTRASGLKISFVPQNTSFLAGSLAEFEDNYRIDPVLFRAILRKLDLSRAHFEKDMQAYSAGQKKKVLLARSLCQSAHLYVWDEPMNYVDVLSRIQLEDLLAEFQPTLVFVEHDRRFCEKIATKTVSL